jgi:gluconolactonase
MVDIAGTFKDMPGGPFAGGAAVERPGHRMLAAIVATPGEGNYFLKLTGPAATIAGQEDAFRKMVEGLVATGQ